MRLTVDNVTVDARKVKCDNTNVTQITVDNVVVWRKSIEIAFDYTNCYGTYTYSKTAYYGDTISVQSYSSYKSIICTTPEGTTRWTNYVYGNNATAYYTYGVPEITGFTGTIGTSQVNNYTALDVYCESQATLRKYTVSFTMGKGVNDMWASNSNPSTSGQGSGSSFNAGSTVYVFAKLGLFVSSVPSTWLISNGAYKALVPGGIYLVKTITDLTSNQSLGVFNATITTYYLDMRRYDTTTSEYLNHGTSQSAGQQWSLERVILSTTSNATLTMQAKSGTGPYTKNFSVGGGGQASFTHKYYLGLGGTIYNAPTYTLWRINSLGSTSVVFSNLSADAATSYTLTTGYYYILMVNRDDGQEETTET